MKIGIVGFSKPHFNKEQARIFLEEAINNFVKESNENTIEIVSGLTNIGIPKISYESAVQNNWLTVGISAKMALQSGCGIFPCDKEIIVGMNFGDESNFFINYIDVLIRVGGGKQSHKEVGLFKDKIKMQNNNISQYLIEKEVEWHGE